VKVLVTGGGGFLGSWICRQLKIRGDQPLAYQRSAAPRLEELGIEVLRGDILDETRLREVLGACDAVIHTAGLAGPWGEAAEYHRINVEGTRTVLDACRATGVRRLVFTSSPSVVHGGEDIEGGDESLPYPDHYLAPYPESKAAAERLVMTASDGELATVSLRPHLVWGPGDNQLLPRLRSRAAGGVIRLPGPGKLIDTVYVENAAAAHLRALDALAENRICHGRTYFISNDEPWPQARIIKALLNAAGMDVEVRAVPPILARTAGAFSEWFWRRTGRSGEPPLTRWAVEQLSTAHWYDISAAREELGYSPAISMKEGLEHLAARFDRG
jgi:nucleoside-diphosphate-sugar epimerase